MKGRIERALIAPVRAVAMALLWPLEVWLQTRATRAPAPACFVVGPPRSGTTLVYELLVERFGFAYISNLAHRLYRTPVAASWLGRGTIRAWHGSFESQYGHIAGWGAPNEGGWVWARWIGVVTPLGAEAADSLPCTQIARTIQGIADALDAPFLNKNVMHSVQMRLLDRLFPGCLFIEVRRDAAANVRSIVRARRKGRGPDRGGWWSVRPEGAGRYAEADLVTQACFQVCAVQNAIDRGAAELGPERRLTLSYEDVCSDPRAALDRVGGFLAAHGLDLPALRDVPVKFHRRGDRPLEDEDEERLTAGIARFFEAGRPEERAAL